jgi:hypothetical protein
MRAIDLRLACVATVIAAGLIGAATADAAPVFYNSRAAFDAATGGGLAFESFEKHWAPAVPTVVFDGFTVQESGGYNALAQLRNYPSGAGISNAITNGTGALWYDDNGSSVGTFFNFTSPIDAFGMDITTSSAATITVGGSVATSTSTGVNSPQFFGVIDTAGLTSLSFSASGGPNIGFDSASYGEVVPEPASIIVWSLMGLAFGGLTWRRRRK